MPDTVRRIGYVQVLFVVPLAIPASMMDDGGWIEKQALEAIARGDWEIEEESPKRKEVSR